MQNLPNKTLVFFIAMLFFTSVSAEELLHDHHEHHDHISVEIDCDFCVNAAPEFENEVFNFGDQFLNICLLYTSPSPRDRTRSRMPSSA